MKVIFAGTPEFAATALAALDDAGFDIPLVLTQPDRPAGRGMKEHPSAVKQYALSHGLPVAQPASLNLGGRHPEAAGEAHRLLHGTPHDVMVVAAYGLILPASILAIPRLGCLNIHASLLPRWRGAAPIHRAIEAGDQHTGITIMQMDQGLDTGPMLASHRIPIKVDDTTGSLHDRLARLGGEMMVSVLQGLERGTVKQAPQPEQGVSYAAKISKDEAFLDFSLDAVTLSCKVRAFNPFPGTVAKLDGMPLKIWQATPVPVDNDLPAGTLMSVDENGSVLVACGRGALRLLELQKPGGKRLLASDFIKGFPLAGKRFESAD